MTSAPPGPLGVEQAERQRHGAARGFAERTRFEQGKAARDGDNGFHHLNLPPQIRAVVVLHRAQRRRLQPVRGVEPDVPNGLSDIAEAAGDTAFVQASEGGVKRLIGDIVLFPVVREIQQLLHEPGASEPSFAAPQRGADGRVVMRAHVRGLDAEQIANAQPNPAELAKLEKFAVDRDAATGFASQGKLSPTSVDYPK